MDSMLSVISSITGKSRSFKLANLLKESFEAESYRKRDIYSHYVYSHSRLFKATHSCTHGQHYLDIGLLIKKMEEHKCGEEAKRRTPESIGRKQWWVDMVNLCIV